MRARIVLFLVVAVLVAGFAEAGVLRVEQNGSGDFLLIQDAVEAAASGDTILIGPGRYDDLQPRGSVEVVAVAYWDDGKELAFIGASAEEVIIGPTAYAPAGTGPQGIHQNLSANVHIEAISFENLKWGVVTGDGLCTLVGSNFDTGENGVFVQNGTSLVVRGCSFRDYESSSISTNGVVNAVIEDCELTNAKVYLGGAEMGIVRNCTVLSGNLVSFVGSKGLVENCSAQCSDFGPCINVSSCDTLGVRGNVIVGGSTNMTIGGPNTYVIAEQNDFSAPIAYHFGLYDAASLDAHDNHIYRSSGMIQYIVMTVNYPAQYESTVDMGSNYWFDDGTPAQLDSLIYDGNDDPALHIIVNYDPIRTEPVPTEKQSFGGLKAMYRDATR